MSSRQRIATVVGYCLWLGLQLPLHATELVREEPIPIRAVISDPQAYHLRTVRLQGVVEALERIPRAGGCGLIDAYIFTLYDMTGTLPISDLGACQNGSRSVQPLMTGFQAGDRVEVVVIVSVLSSPNFDSRSMEANLRWIKRVPEP